MARWGRGCGTEENICEDPPTTATRRAIVRFAYLPWTTWSGGVYRSLAAYGVARVVFPLERNAVDRA